MASKIIANYLPEIFALGFYRSKPGMVTVNLTRRCNQQCIYCEIGMDLPSVAKDTLTLDDLKWIIDQMAESHIPKISLCGGEPFLFDGIIDVVSYAFNKNIRSSITTNGMTVHHLSEDDLNRLMECKTEINISVDSFEDGIQCYTRGTPAALHNALKSIWRLTEKGIPVTVLTVISKYNFRHLSDFFITAFEKGIKQVLFQPVIYHSNYPDRLPVNGKSQLNVGADQLDELMDELKKILQFERRHRINTNVYRIYPWIRCYLITASSRNNQMFFEPLLKRFFCRELYAIIDIAYDGGIQPCGLTPSTISIIGNRQPGLMTLWLKATAEIKANLQNGRFYDCCNGCCHHFSRNMLASIARHPVKNRMALIRMLPLIISRIISRLTRNLYFYSGKISPATNQQSPS